MAQSWHDLLFAHWEVDPNALRELVPSSLDLDLFEEKGKRRRAFVGVVPFRMSGIRPRFCPPLPWLSAFPELNVRTYVTVDGKPGVYFFSLDATNFVAVALARAWFHLPYFNARMRLMPSDKGIRYSHHRTHRGANPADFIGSYGPVGEVYHAQPGSLDHWLTERYCLYSLDRRGNVYRGEIHHVPWPLQPARARIDVESTAAAAGIELLKGTEPLLHFAKRLDVIVWQPKRLRPA